RYVPLDGLGRVVKTTAVSCEFCRMSSLRIRCCALDGRSLNESCPVPYSCGIVLYVLFNSLSFPVPLEFSLTNPIDGPAVSSSATAVLGIARLVKAGVDVRCSNLGRFPASPLEGSI